MSALCRTGEHAPLYPPPPPTGPLPLTFLVLASLSSGSHQDQRQEEEEAPNLHPVCGGRRKRGGLEVGVQCSVEEESGRLWAACVGVRQQLLPLQHSPTCVHPRALLVATQQNMFTNCNRKVNCVPQQLPPTTELQG